jgi:CMP-N,N'-diacetyllegionaminic acid synthase
MSPLFLIAARGGSKGLPGKNIKLLGGKPLLQYSIEIARTLAPDEHICLSSDCQEIIEVAEQNQLEVPFVRPAEFATDESSSRDFIIHALEVYRKKGIDYDSVVLLQATSPFRNTDHIKEMIQTFTPSQDMVVSVYRPHVNPYFSLFEEDNSGYLKLSKKGEFIRRQDCPEVYAYNGSVYVINAKAIYRKNFRDFVKVKKFVMDEIHSIDIDNQFDWWIAEMILEKGLWGKSKNK